MSNSFLFLFFSSCSLLPPNLIFPHIDHLFFSLCFVLASCDFIAKKIQGPTDTSPERNFFFFIYILIWYESYTRRDNTNGADYGMPIISVSLIPYNVQLHVILPVRVDDSYLYGMYDSFSFHVILRPYNFF